MGCLPACRVWKSQCRGCCGRQKANEITQGKLGWKQNTFNFLTTSLSLPNYLLLQRRIKQIKHHTTTTTHKKSSLAQKIASI